MTDLSDLIARIEGGADAIDIEITDILRVSYNGQYFYSTTERFIPLRELLFRIAAALRARESEK